MRTTIALAALCACGVLTASAETIRIYGNAYGGYEYGSAGCEVEIAGMGSEYGISLSVHGGDFSCGWSVVNSPETGEIAGLQIPNPESGPLLSIAAIGEVQSEYFSWHVGQGTGHLTLFDYIDDAMRPGNVLASVALLGWVSARVEHEWPGSIPGEPFYSRSVFVTITPEASVPEPKTWILVAFGSLVAVASKLRRSIL